MRRSLNGSIKSVVISTRKIALLLNVPELPTLSETSKKTKLRIIDAREFLSNHPAKRELKLVRGLPGNARASQGMK